MTLFLMDVCVYVREGGKRKRMTRVCVFLFFVVSFQAESPLECLKGREREKVKEEAETLHHNVEECERTGERGNRTEPPAGSRALG